MKYIVEKDDNDNYKTITRSSWKKCEGCESCVNCIHSLSDQDDVLSPCNNCYGNNIKYKPRFFCQFCGRPLTNEAWDILEKRLKKIKIYKNKERK